MRGPRPARTPAARSGAPAPELPAERSAPAPGRLAHLLTGPLATTVDGTTRTDPALDDHPLKGHVLAHESVHAAQFRAWQRGAPAAAPADLEREAEAGAGALRAGAPFTARQGAPAGVELRFDPPDAVSGADPAAGPAPPATGLSTLDLSGLTGIRSVTLPGQTEPRLLPEGGPVDPEILVALLWGAVANAARWRVAAWLDRDKSALTVPEVLRLGDRASWIKARVLWEASGAGLLASLKAVLSERELGAVLPYLRGVVPVEELIRVWDGVFSSDVDGVVRTLERMPDDEVLGMIDDYRTSGRLTGTAADSLAGTVEQVVKGEDDGGYRALRALAARVRRAAAGRVAAQPEDDQAARDLAAELRVRAAFVRIKEGDRRWRPELAYLAVSDLGPAERYLLDTYLRSWRPEHLSGQERNSLQVLVNSNEDIAVILRALEESRSLAERRDRAENALGLQVAAEALGPALNRLTEQARDASLPEAERQFAADQLAAFASDDHTVGRLLDLPGGQRLVTQGLGLSPAQLARHLVLRAASTDQLMAALRGLDPWDIGQILDSADVRDHLREKELEVSEPMQRVLGAYATLAGARPELFADLQASTAAGIRPEFTLVLPGAGDRPATGGGPDPVVVVAAYQIYQAAKNKDLAAVVAAVRPLRGSQRAQLADEGYFAAALAFLRSSPWEGPSRTIADVIADPAADLSRAADTLVAAGLMGEPGYAFDVSDQRLLAEGLSVAPADRRLLRYHYVIEALQEEQRLAGVTDWQSQRYELARRGVPPDLAIGPDLEKAYGDRMFVIDRLDPVPRLKAEEAFLGDPELLRSDLSPAEAALEAEFMRIRLGKQLAAAAAGIDASGVFGWSPETLVELATEFDRTWQRLGADGSWTHDDLVQLAAAYYDALDAVDRNRRERDHVAQFVGSLAAVVAAVVTIMATGGTATPSVLALLSGSALGAGGTAAAPFALTLVAGTVFGAGADALVAAQFRDYTSPDQAFGDVAHGAVSAALTIAGDVLANKAGAVIGRAMARDVAMNAVERAVAWTARSAVEGAINGAVFGAGDAVFATVIDRSTWERGVLAIFSRFLSAAVQGAFVGGVTGAVAGPVLGAGFAGAGRVLGAVGRRLGLVGREAAAVQRIAAFAEQGRLDMALRHLDELTLTGVQREALTQELYRRALASGAEGAAIPDQVVRELEHARQVTRSLDYEAGPARTGGRPRLDTKPVEDLLSRLEGKLGAAELAQLRKVIFGEIRLAPEELVVQQQAFRRGLDQAIEDLVPATERATLPPYEVRVVPPEAFEGMFRTRQDMALTLVEGDRAVVYVRSDANVRTYMLQEAAHVRQLGDPLLAADMRLLSERNVLSWADKTPVQQLQLLTVQRRLELDAQQRIIAALTPEVPYAADAAGMADELAAAHARLDELRLHEQWSAAITPAQLADMEAGMPRPAWMDQEARLFGRKVDPAAEEGLTVSQGKVPGGTMGGSREPSIVQAQGEAGVLRHTEEILAQLRQLQAAGRYAGTRFPLRVPMITKAQLSQLRNALDAILTTGDPALTRAFADQLGPAGAREVPMPVGRGTKSGLAGSRKVDHLFPDPANSTGIVMRESKNLWETGFSLDAGSHTLRELQDDLLLLRHPGFGKARLEWRVDSQGPLSGQAVLDLQREVQALLPTETFVLPPVGPDGNVIGQTVLVRSNSGRIVLDFRIRTTPF